MVIKKTATEIEKLKPTNCDCNLPFAVLADTILHKK